MNMKELKEAAIEAVEQFKPIAAFAVPVAAVTVVGLAVAPASAATTIIDPNIIDFTNLSTMIGNVAGIIPGIVTLVVSTVPLFIVNGVVYLIMGIFAGVIAMFTFK